MQDRDQERRMTTLEVELKGLREDLSDIKTENRLGNSETKESIHRLEEKLDTFIQTITSNYVTKGELEQFEKRWKGAKWRDQLMTGLVATILATLAGYFIRDILGR